MKIKNILTVALSGAVIFGFPIAMLVSKDRDYSMSERRTLAQLPAVSAETLKNGRFMTDFESWSLDQFPLRDAFRTMKMYASRNVFFQKDNHGYYLKNGYISKLEYPMNPQKIDIAADKLTDVYRKFIVNSGGDVYMSIIPDKNYFTAPLGGYPTMDYEGTVNKLCDKLEFAQYIDIFDTLALDSYYRTDQHWRQEKIIGTAQRLAEGMGASISTDLTVNELDTPFYGTYHRQSALLVPPDDISYLTSPVLDNCKVVGLDTGKPQEMPVYDMEKAIGRDPYEMFLCGSQAVMTIENPMGDPDKKLIIFRDSFGSSITPILASGYSKITLVDLRYVQSAMLGNLIDFSDRDVLFLYSTLVINNTISM